MCAIWTDGFVATSHTLLVWLLQVPLMGVVESAVRALDEHRGDALVARVVLGLFARFAKEMECKVWASQAYAYLVHVICAAAHAPAEALSRYQAAQRVQSRTIPTCGV